MAVPRQILVALVEDKPGVLNRVAGLFRRRGFNIASLAVGHSETPNMSRMTIVVEGDEGVRQQAARQLRKLIGVMEVRDITDDAIVARELTLIKVKALPKNRSDMDRVRILQTHQGPLQYTLPKKPFNGQTLVFKVPSSNQIPPPANHIIVINLV